MQRNLSALSSADQLWFGLILTSDDPDAYGCINNKRVDLLVDGDCRARHAIEYQGTGHHQGTAAARDAVKKEALRKAGVGYDEVVAGKTTPSDLKRPVVKVVPAIQCLNNGYRLDQRLSTSHRISHGT